ncbi:B12-binding domain-containing protein [Streptomyces sp. NPDC001380]|uniref:cobalamin B12-binding domain-containing protein n=1 Tax=Streptomyces sp. NPDC001380 TaxID=3364566 RepID=UPI0036A0D213
MTTATRPALDPDVRSAYDAHLARADEDAAAALVLGLLDAGWAPERILLDLVAPAQVAVGERWASAEWSVAQEHAATHVSEQTVAALAAATRRPAEEGAGSIVVACVDGEWHALPARILAEVLRLRGFRVTFLGAHVPAPHLVSYLHQHGPDLAALSCMLPVRLPRAHRMVEAARLAGVPVLAGGPGFGPDGAWAAALGADLYAADAAGAADLLQRGWPPPFDGAVSLPHLADEEYAQLVRRRPELLRHLVDTLHERFPAMRDYSDHQHEATLEDLGHLLDFLTAGVFVDDPRVLTGFLDFSAHILAARRVPPAGLHLAVDALTGPLHDFPRTLAHLTAGKESLEGAGHAHSR